MIYKKKHNLNAIHHGDLNVSLDPPSHTSNESSKKKKIKSSFVSMPSYFSLLSWLCMGLLFISNERSAVRHIAEGLANYLATSLSWLSQATSSCCFSPHLTLG